MKPENRIRSFVVLSEEWSKNEAYQDFVCLEGSEGIATDANSLDDHRKKRLLAGERPVPPLGSYDRIIKTISPTCRDINEEIKVLEIDEKRKKDKEDIDRQFIEDLRKAEEEAGKRYGMLIKELEENLEKCKNLEKTDNYIHLQNKIRKLQDNLGISNEKIEDDNYINLQNSAKELDRELRAFINKKPNDSRQKKLQELKEYLEAKKKLQDLKKYPEARKKPLEADKESRDQPEVCTDKEAHDDSERLLLKVQGLSEYPKAGANKELHNYFEKLRIETKELMNKVRAFNEKEADDDYKNRKNELALLEEKLSAFNEKEADDDYKSTQNKVKELERELGDFTSKKADDYEKTQQGIKELEKNLTAFNEKEADDDYKSTQKKVKELERELRDSNERETDDYKNKQKKFKELKKELVQYKNLQDLKEELKAYNDLEQLQTLNQNIAEYKKLQRLKEKFKSYKENNDNDCTRIKEELEALKKEKNAYQEWLKAKFTAATTDYLYHPPSKQGKQEKAGGRSWVQIAPKFIPLGNMVRFGGSSRK